WYWILLPPDQFGTRLTGWIRGNAVDEIQAPQAASAATASPTETPLAADAGTDARTALRDAPMSGPVETAPSPRAVVTEVVLNFEFGKSALTDEARQKLESAIAQPSLNAKPIAVALEGHADWIGREAYNDDLGM